MSEWGDDPRFEPTLPPPPPSWPAGYPHGPGPLPLRQPKTDSGATTALVLGILGFLCCLFGFAAIYEGHEARQRIVGAPDELKGEGLAIAGMTLGIISLALSALGTILVFVV